MYCRNCGSQISDQAAFCVHCGVPPYSGNKYCPVCGAETNPNAVVCIKCGADLTGHRSCNSYQNDPTISERNGLVALLLAIFLGELGVHSFYCGKTGIGIAQLFTLGGCGIWALIDIIMIACGTYKDKDGKYVKIQA